MNIDIQKMDIILIMVTFSIYAVFLIGISLIYYSDLKNLSMKIKMKNRLKARKNLSKNETKLEQHLRKVLSASMKKPIEPQNFIVATAVTFLLIIFIGVQNVSISSAVCMAALISGMPYLLIRVRLETLRRKGSYEGERLISEFLSQYRICDFNIYKTIEQVILISAGTKVSGKLLFKLLLEIRNTGNADVIKNATENFAYGINTNWSRMLANNIRISAESGIDVSMAIEDILIQLREARAMTEERKRLNSEASRMVVFLIPAMYVGTVFMSVKYLDIGFAKFIRNQLYTEQGFILLLFMAFLFLANLALIEIVNNQRFDY